MLWNLLKKLEAIMMLTRQLEANEPFGMDRGVTVAPFIIIYCIRCAFVADIVVDMIEPRADKTIICTTGMKHFRLNAEPHLIDLSFIA